MARTHTHTHTQKPEAVDGFMLERTQSRKQTRTPTHPSRERTRAREQKNRCCTWLPARVREHVCVCVFVPHPTCMLRFDTSVFSAHVQAANQPGPKVSIRSRVIAPRSAVFTKLFITRVCLFIDSHARPTCVLAQAAVVPACELACVRQVIRLPSERGERARTGAPVDTRNSIRTNIALHLAA